MKMFKLEITQMDELTELSETLLTAYHCDRDTLVEVAGCFVEDSYEYPVTFYRLPRAFGSGLYWTDNAGLTATIEAIN